MIKTEPVICMALNNYLEEQDYFNKSTFVISLFLQTGVSKTNRNVN
jgi:hypothetical protein